MPVPSPPRTWVHGLTRRADRAADAYSLSTQHAHRCGLGKKMLAVFCRRGIWVLWCDVGPVKTGYRGSWGQVMRCAIKVLWFRRSLERYSYAFCYRTSYILNAWFPGDQAAKLKPTLGDAALSAHALMSGILDCLCNAREDKAAWYRLRTKSTVADCWFFPPCTTVVMAAPSLLLLLLENVIIRVLLQQEAATVAGIPVSNAKAYFGR